VFLSPLSKMASAIPLGAFDCIRSNGSRDFLVVVGAALQPALKRLWERINRPSPLDPQTKGGLVTSLAMAENSLERLNYLREHTKDLFLYLIQLVLATLLLSILALSLYTFRLLGRNPDVVLLAVVVLLIFAGILSFVGLWEAGRMSDNKIGLVRGICG
jgi:hypothetical protein